MPKAATPDILTLPYAEAGDDLRRHLLMATAIDTANELLEHHRLYAGLRPQMEPGERLTQERWEDAARRIATVTHVLADLSVAQWDDQKEWHQTAAAGNSRTLRLIDLLRSVGLTDEQQETLTRGHIGDPAWTVHDGQIEERETVAHFTEWLRRCPPHVRSNMRHWMAMLCSSAAAVTLLADGNGVGDAEPSTAQRDDRLDVRRR